MELIDIKEKLQGIFAQDRFETDFRNALKKRKMTLSDKTGDNLYDVSNGITSVSVDVSKMRSRYNEKRSADELNGFAGQIELDFAAKGRLVSFTNSQGLLRIILMRERDVKKSYVASDFMNGLKKVVVYTSDDEHIHMLDDNSIRNWGVPDEVLFSVADRNMCKLLAKAKFKESVVIKNLKALEIDLPNKELGVAMMACSDFRQAVYKRLGAKFLAVAPSRESMLILDDVTNDILEGLGAVIMTEYKMSGKPLTTDVLLYSSAGITVAGRFHAETDGPEGEPDDADAE